MTNREILKAFYDELSSATTLPKAFINEKFNPSGTYLKVSTLFIEKDTKPHCGNKIGFLGVNLFFKEFTGYPEYMDIADQIAGYFKAKKIGNIQIGDDSDDEPKIGEIITSRDKKGWMFIPITIYFEVQ